MSFFAGVEQEDVAIRDFKGKSPLFYREAHIMGAVFTADLDALRKALPDPWYRPFQILPGRGLIALHCMEYRDTDIGPYNEVSLAIPVRRSGSLPPLELLSSLRSGDHHAYIADLPVDTEPALYGGIDFFNYPKYLADITFRETSTHRVCTLRDRDTHDLILEFEGRRLAARTAAPSERDLLTLHTYPRIEDRPNHARLLVNRIERASRLCRGAGLRYGPHPRADAFKNLLIGRLVHYAYAPRCQAILFKPRAL